MIQSSVTLHFLPIHIPCVCFRKACFTIGVCVSFDFTYKPVDKRVFVTFACFFPMSASTYFVLLPDISNWLIFLAILAKTTNPFIQLQKKPILPFYSFLLFFWCLIRNKFPNVRTWKCKCHPCNTVSFLSKNRAVKQKPLFYQVLLHTKVSSHSFDLYVLQNILKFILLYSQFSGVTLEK